MYIQQARRAARLSPSATGQDLTDEDHKSCFEYLFRESVEQRPTIAELRQKAHAARAAVDDLAEQHACACCDMLIVHKKLTEYSLEEPADALWGPLSDENIDLDELHPKLRDQYRLTHYAETADNSWATYMLSPLSLFEADGVPHIRVCDTCITGLSKDSVPKLAIRNHLWIGKFDPVEYT